MISKTLYNFLCLNNNAHGMTIDVYENDAMSITCISPIDAYIGSDVCTWIQRTAKRDDSIFDFALELKEAEELLIFLKDNFAITAPQDFTSHHYSEFTFSHRWGYIWFILKVKKEISPLEIPFLLEDLFTLEFNQKQLSEFIKKLEKVILAAKEEELGNE